MKKILFSLFLAVIMAVPALSAAYNPVSRVTTVGSTLMSKNGLPSVTFKITEDAVSNDNILSTNVLYVSKNDLKYTGNDNEVAAVIAKEIGAIVNATATKKQIVTSFANAVVSSIGSESLQNAAALTNQLSLYNMSAKDQIAADVTGTDLMITAGYNPLAMIVTLGKMDGSYLEILKGSPANINRTMNIYDYLSYNYPSKVKAGYNCQEYRNFLAYIQPTIDERNSNSKVMAKFKKEQAKAKKQRAKQLAKYKMTGGVSGWDVSKTLLQNYAGS